MIKSKKKRNRLIVLIAVLVIIAAAVVVTLVQQAIYGKISREVSLEEAQQIVDETFEALPGAVSMGAKYLEQNTEVTVESLSYGSEKDVILECSYVTKDVKSVVEQGIDKYMTAAYGLYEDNLAEGVKTNATKIMLLVSEEFQEDLLASQTISGKVRIRIYETQPEVFTLYLSDEVVNTVFGGLLDAQEIINSVTTVTYNGEEISIVNQNTLRNGVRECISLKNYDSKKPDTAVGLMKVWNDIKFDFSRNFIANRQWTYITNGLLNTLQITALSLLIGVFIGFLVAVIRVTNEKTGKLDLLSGICKLYVTITRGVPLMVQLLIMYFVILLPLGVERFAAAVLCFGLNSGAYVSEIVRGGIMSIDAGQTEAGRSLGFTYMQTMYHIVIPQAFKAVLPSLANEFIALLKETSVAFYIGVADLTQGGLKIRSITYSSFMPLIGIAIVYLVVVLILSKGVSILERRLRKSDNR